jgi:hypothetical protein
MVAMIDPRSLSSMFTFERNAAALPLTVTVLDPTKSGRAGQPSTYRLVSVGVEQVAGFDGEPTWEDAEWQ